MTAITLIRFATLFASLALVGPAGLEANRPAPRNQPAAIPIEQAAVSAPRLEPLEYRESAACEAVMAIRGNDEFRASPLAVSLHPQPDAMPDGTF